MVPVATLMIISVLTEPKNVCIEFAKSNAAFPFGIEGFRSNFAFPAHFASGLVI